MMKYASEYFSYPYFVDVSIQTQASNIPHEYYGNLTLYAFGESVDFPVVLSRSGRKKHVSFAIDNDGIIARINAFNERVKLDIIGEESSPVNSSSLFLSLPQWVYGTWACTTPLGTETIKIDEYGGIWSFRYGDASYGSYSYSECVIRAKFPNDGGITTSYRLDIQNQRIEYGGGYFFHKN